MNELMTMKEYLAQRASREPGVTGCLDTAEEMEPVHLTYETWSQIERDMAGIKAS